MKRANCTINPTIEFQDECTIQKNFQDFSQVMTKHKNRSFKGVSGTIMMRIGFEDECTLWIILFSVADFFIRERLVLEWHTCCNLTWNRKELASEDKYMKLAPIESELESLQNALLEISTTPMEVFLKRFVWWFSNSLFYIWGHKSDDSKCHFINCYSRVLGKRSNAFVRWLRCGSSGACLFLIGIIFVELLNIQLTVHIIPKKYFRTL